MNERGVALPMALIVLVTLTALILAFAVLASNEPTIAGNHLSSTAARSVAESGVERAIWALGPALGPHPGGPAVDLLFAIPRLAAVAPYDGINEFGLVVAANPGVTGGYAIQIAPGAKINEVNVTSTGWQPSRANARGKRIIRVTLLSLATKFDPPGALNVNGDLQVSGNATVRANGSVCRSPGTPATGSYAADQTLVEGSANVCAGAACSDQKTNCVSPSCVQFAPNAPATFDRLKLTPEDLQILKTYAKMNGTYWGPGQLGPNPGSWNGSVTFTTVPSGIVFIDTISGQPPSASNPSDMSTVRITGDQAAGWVVVMGSADIAGRTNYTGLIYAADDVTAGNGDAVINGAVVAHNLNNSNGSQIDTTTNGSITINYDCAGIATGGGRIPQGFVTKPGTWREVSG